MNERKKMILFSIINSYVNLGEPIGSNSLLNEYSLDISSATIRNEMSTLEKMGLLEKAHTSGGRYPSDKGYRLYVNNLLENSLNEKEDENLEKILDKRYGNVSKIVETATLLLSKMTNLTAVSYTIRNNITKVINLELLKIDPNMLLFVVVYDNASIVSDRIYISEEIDDEKLIEISRILKQNIEGKNLKDLAKIFEKIKNSGFKQYENLLDILEKKINNDSLSDLTKEVIIKGLGNIFNFKEFEDPIKAREFIKIFDSKERIWELIENSNNELQITIGDENEINELKDNTIITSHFNYDKDIVGQIGIIGLTRIDYKEVISDIKLISDLLSK
ncbi:MAG: heat-inducible transcriptional repressor HrcA [Anaerococcus vaginalis]|uniref:heat-inducible transcriptional repressor HrcA n=1 Tax=Anaerococcus TaxID=165779 RepID=UPI0018991A7C|nr:heat-inducible transcriptional repressor HrcA [Anaerococcus vaginalis]MDU2648183.1 heat-inducible transcriptional repressor HrcA [Anaerococcus vaginalis]MDU4378445.1 heat-inducible transcriptional repressor HrcA [Anaerococcus vaginalis]MDU4447562.1 heat-inducible transcriptional repressor HrcA [Anaerococcus vaginalis]MDU5823844.1 heat-inducible transcriptional repressor HrcA [Anaerococcus vaginalis]MDU6182459.1 heat-inducible transcriptional repressor HrcA [Anaerococcus vaginalis]